MLLLLASAWLACSSSKGGDAADAGAATDGAMDGAVSADSGAGSDAGALRQLGAATQVVAGDVDAPSLAAGDSDWTAGWMSRQPTTSSATYARVAGDGTLAGAPVTVSAARHLRVRWSRPGNAYGVFWSTANVATSNDQVNYARADTAGASGSTLAWELAGSGYGVFDDEVALADGWAVAGCFESGGASFFRMRVATLTAAGATRGTPQELFSGTDSCRDAALGAGGGYVWLAFTREIPAEGHSAVFLRRLTLAGAPAGDDVRVSATTEGAGTPRVFASDAQVVVAYTTAGTKFFSARRFDLAPAALGERIRLNVDDADPTSIWEGAPRGAGYAAAWVSGPNGRRFGALFVQSFGSDGAPASAPLQVEPSADVREIARLAWRGEELGVLYRDRDEAAARKLYLGRFVGF